jgi:hypothetical protein
MQSSPEVLKTREDIERWREIRKQAGLAIDPETAEVDWVHAQTLDCRSPTLKRPATWPLFSRIDQDQELYPRAGPPSPRVERAGGVAVF